MRQLDLQENDAVRFESPPAVTFVNPERAKHVVRCEPVVFAEIMDQAPGAQSLEVHVMRPSREGLYEELRNDTGPVPGELIHALVARIAVAHHCRFATIYPAEDRWPPAWALDKPGRSQRGARPVQR